MDTNDCAVYAISFTCNVCPDDARYRLWREGRSLGDGATDRQVSRVVRGLLKPLRRVRPEAKTIRGFAKLNWQGKYLVFASDHVVAVVDGYVCDRPGVSDLLRIDKVLRVC